MIQFFKEFFDSIFSSRLFSDELNVQTVLGILMCAGSVGMVIVLFASGMLAKKKKNYEDIVNANDNHVAFENESETYVSDDDEVLVRMALLGKKECDIPKYRGKDIDQTETKLRTGKNPWGFNE